MSHEEYFKDVQTEEKATTEPPAKTHFTVVIENVETLIITPDKLDFQTTTEE